MRAALPILATAVLACSARHVPPAPPPLRPAPVEDPLPAVGPLESAPAGRLSHDFEPTRYAVALDIDPRRQSFTATIQITGTLAEPRDVIWLHAEGLTIGRVTAKRDGIEQRLVPTLPTAQLLALQSPSPLAAGTWTLSIDYSGLWNDAEAEGGFRQQLPAATGERYVFTMFEADFARRVVPCIDEPDRKVPWEVTITAPTGLEVASNSPVDKIEQRAGSQTVHFAPTPPIPTYLVAFAVGPFEVVDGGRAKSGAPVRILTQRGHRSLTTYAASATAGLVDKLEAWLGVPFPYAKLDVVTVPRHPDWWFAMENPGLVTIGLEALDDNDSWDHTMAHEIAHHWFGDLVTLAWWDDLWLNKSFAEWAAKIAIGTAPTRLGYWPSVIKGNVSHPRRDFPQMHGVREKGERLIERLALYLGADRFRAALAQYLQAHAHGVVTTHDVVAALDAATGEPLGPLVDDFWSARHIKGTTVACKGRKRPRFVVQSSDATDPSPVACVTYERDGKRVETCKRVSGSPAGFDLDTKTCPRWFIGEQLDSGTAGAIADAAWDQLTSYEQYLVVSQSKLDDRLIARISAAGDKDLIQTVVDKLWRAREAIDASERPRLDAWIVDTLGADARRNGFARRPNVAALVAAAGDATLLAEARARVAEPSSYRHIFARKALLHGDPDYAAKQFDEMLAKPDLRSEYAYDLEHSPFIFELVRKNAERVKAKLGGAYLHNILCSAPDRDIIALANVLAPDLAKALAPDASVWSGPRRVLDACVVSRRAAADAVRKILDARPTRDAKR